MALYRIGYPHDHIIIKNLTMCLLPERGWIFFLQFRVDVHDLIVDDGPQNLQRLDIKLNLALSVFLLHFLKLAK